MLHASLQVTNFTLNEVALYLKSVGVPRGFPSSEDVFALTKGNPLLLSSLTSRNKHTYSLLDLEIELESLMAPLVASLIRNVLKNDVIKYLLGENCDLAALAEAEEMISVDKFRHKRYRNTWLMKENLVYAVESEDGKNYYLYSNFPNMYRFIIKALKRGRLLTPHVENPQVKGYLFEHQFFERVVDVDLQLSLCSIEDNARQFFSVCLQDLTIVNNPFVKNMARNAVYRLPNCHTGVDAVLFYSVPEGNCYLFFFQLSISSYSQHKSKVNSLYKVIPKSVSDKDHPQSVSILKYYRSLVKVDKVIIAYVYVSPRELTTDSVNRVETDLKQHET